MLTSKQQVKELLTIWGATPSFIQDIDDEMTDGIYVIHIGQYKDFSQSYEWYAWDIQEDGPIPGIVLYVDPSVSIHINIEKYNH